MTIEAGPILRVNRGYHIFELPRKVRKSLKIDSKGGLSKHASTTFQSNTQPVYVIAGHRPCKARESGGIQWAITLIKGDSEVGSLLLE